MAIGSKLKELLNKRGLTVKDFAKQIGVPATTLYSFIQRDRESANIDLLSKICIGLEISIDELVENNRSNNGIKVGELFAGVGEKVSEDIGTFAAHIDAEEFTEEELEEIRQFAEFVKSKRKKD